jgi:hypothetical protein
MPVTFLARVTPSLLPATAVLAGVLVLPMASLSRAQDAMQRDMEFKESLGRSPTYRPDEAQPAFRQRGEARNAQGRIVDGRRRQSGEKR